MRDMRIAALAAAVVLCLTPGLEAQAPVVTAIWASKPRTPPPYPPGHRPWIRLDALKAAHRGEAGWRETVVNDGRLVAEYVAGAPGTAGMSASGADSTSGAGGNSGAGGA